MTKSVITEALRPIELHQVDRPALSQKLEAALNRVTRKLDKILLPSAINSPAKPVRRASGRAPITWNGPPVLAVPAVAGVGDDGQSALSRRRRALFTVVRPAY